MFDINWTSYVPECWWWHSSRHQDMNSMVHFIHLVTDFSANANSICCFWTFGMQNGPFIPGLCLNRPSRKYEHQQGKKFFPGHVTSWHAVFGLKIKHSCNHHNPIIVGYVPMSMPVIPFVAWDTHVHGSNLNGQIWTLTCFSNQAPQTLSSLGLIIFLRLKIQHLCHGQNMVEHGHHTIQN